MGTNVRQLVLSTDSNGNALSPQPSLQYPPDATNDQIYSNDLTNAEWTASNVTVAQDEVGVESTPDTACTLTATAANGTVLANAITAASDTHASAWHIKRKTGTGTIELTVDGGTTWQDITSLISSSFARIAVDQATVTDPQIGIRIVTSGDAVIVGNCEVHLNKTLAEVRGLPPIFTTSAAVSIDRADYTFDIANHDDAQGAYYLEVESAGDQNILASFLSQVDPNYSLDDGTTTTTGTPISGDVDKVGLVYSSTDNLMAINIEGSWSSDVSYDGTMLSGILDLFRSGTYPAKIRNIRRYQGGTYGQLKAKIDEAML